MFETLSRKPHPQKVVCRPSELLHPLLTRDSKERQVHSYFCTGSLMNLKPFLPSHILPFRSALESTRSLFKACLQMPSSAEAFFPVFNVYVATSVKMGTQQIFYITLYLSNKGSI